MRNTEKHRQRRFEEKEYKLQHIIRRKSEQRRVDLAKDLVENDTNINVVAAPNSFSHTST